ncbi:MAG: DUF86 domain-containing protein [Oscillospiraceae bacterium]|jgi:uncharacterized protein with HEPN domain|nr:DUF86 domain-containing protein [Oscillospiraceae bacterium]
MNKGDLSRIMHMKRYCEDIADAVSRFGNSYEVFTNDVHFLNTVSMSIMQIGELSIGITDEFKEATRTQIQWGMMRGMRNRFAHSYAEMGKEDIWETATKDIPVLLSFCERVIEKDELESGKAKKRDDRDAR